MSKIKLAGLPEHGLRGELTMPGDKSISHRALMIGAISHGKTVVDHFLWSNDCQQTLKALQALGVELKTDRQRIIISGQGFSGLKAVANWLEMGNSGTTARLLMGILAGRDFTSYLRGDVSLSRRPMKRVSQPLSQFGAKIIPSSTGTLPLKIEGNSLHGSTVKLTVASAQVKSALIFAALQAAEPSTIIEKLPTRNHTEIMLQKFGAKITTASDNLTIRIEPGAKLTGQEIKVPGDISSAAFFLVAATIVPHSDLIIKNVNLNPTRTGILRVLKKMGAAIEIDYLPNDGEPLGKIEVRSAQLQPIEIQAAEIPAIIDELPLVALLAACASGTSKITGAAELRVKETDRIATVAAELKKLGVQVTELPDGMIIQGISSWQQQTDQLESYGDHRIGMMLAIAALRSKQQFFLNHAEAVAVSYPEFFNDLQTLIQNSR
ncbi:3-phosphoshikimate 1-carboxyvinyltransferase [Liquorilactobacillus vini]|uniref:3-phosphoshikimate 1-carboxyvinyltransferase n=1 Tax=Liquorilactobacillus vini TaxID=238015 RepID=UPI000316ED85|nr:3-phosphoshikimate 1-carboxyvinyltransferase [Liquorilactobacillus vini]